MRTYINANGVVHSIVFHLTANSQNLFYYKISEHFVYNKVAGGHHLKWSISGNPICTENLTIGKIYKVSSKQMSVPADTTLFE